MTTAIEPALLDVQGAADYLAVKPSYVRRLIRERLVPFIKLGHLVRFRPADLDTLIEAGRRDAILPEVGILSP